MTARRRLRWFVLFQYPLMDRLGFWGPHAHQSYHYAVEFQYPLMDRLGFWGLPAAV